MEYEKIIQLINDFGNSKLNNLNYTRNVNINENIYQFLFELKKENYFSKEKGVNEALYGRNDTDHGLYDYIISNSGISVNDKEEIIVKKIMRGIGVGFDGKKFIFHLLWALFFNSPETQIIIEIFRILFQKIQLGESLPRCVF